jgi:hypothetical protein
MAAFMAAFSHLCNNSTRGALPRVVVSAQPSFSAPEHLLFSPDSHHEISWQLRHQLSHGVVFISY